MEGEEARQLPESDIGEFLTSPGEKMLFAIRKHLFIVIVPVIGTIFFSAIAMVLSFFIFTGYFSDPLLFIATSLLLAVFGLASVVKIIIDWYFHVYLVTNRKILEVCYKPFFSETVSDVLLDQVRCTEVVVQTNGLINHLTNKGDISICFDMPTRQDQFVLYDIAKPHKAGIFLSELLNTAKTTGYSSGSFPVWYRRNPSLSGRRLMDRIVSATRLGTG